MPLFGRRKDSDGGRGPTGDLACDHPSCPRHDAVRCSYQDRRGRECATQWCRDHYQLVDGAAYCRRHVSVAGALRAHAEGVAIAPELDNRAPSLCEWVANVIEPTVLEQLNAVKGRPDQVVSSEPLALLIEGTPRQRFWERSWKLSDHTGTLVKLSIRVLETADREVMVVVGRETSAVLVPPWVDNRSADTVTRDAFHGALVRHLVAGRDRYLELNRQALEGRLTI